MNGLFNSIIQHVFFAVLNIRFTLNKVLSLPEIRKIILKFFLMML